MQSTHPTSEELSALLDGELPPAEAEAVRGHIETCGPCGAELDKLRATVAMLRVLPAAPLPRSFRVPEERPRGRLLAFPALRLPSPVALRALAGAAAALMVVIFVADAARVGVPQAESGASLRASPAQPAASELQADRSAARQDPRALAPQRGPATSGGASASQVAPAAPSEAPALVVPAGAPPGRDAAATGQAPEVATREAGPAWLGWISGARLLALVLAVLAGGLLGFSFRPRGDVRRE